MDQNYAIIPAHNEEKNIARIIQEVKHFVPNIIVIDDGSNDRTQEIAEREGVTYLKHKVNLGKGAALKTGCDLAYINGAKNFIVLDADGQHDPKEIPKFLDALKEVEIVFSHRKPNKSMPKVLHFGNWFINKTFSMIFSYPIKDSQCGYRAFIREAYKKIRWNVSDYFMETEMLIKASKEKLSYKQIPIETIYSDNYKGTTVLDGMKIVASLLAWRILK